MKPIHLLFAISCVVAIRDACAAEGFAPLTARTNAVLITPALINQLAEPLRSNSPVVLAANQRVRAATENAKGVRTWDDPMLKLGGVAAREAMRADEGDIIYGVEQKLPLFGKPALARKVAETAIDSAKADTDYQFQVRRAEFTRHLLRAAVSDRLVAIGQQDLAWLETLVATLEQRNQAGQASQVETLKARNEQSRRTQRLQTDATTGEHESMALNLMFQRDIAAKWPLFELPALAPPISHHELERYALGFEPKLRMLRNQFLQAQAAARLTQRERWPNVSVGVEARNYTGDGSFRQGMFLLGMNFPWGNNARYRSDIARDEAKTEAARYDFLDYELSVREQIHKLALAVDVSRREALLYRDQIVPRSDATLASVRASWEAGRTMLNDVLEARRMLLEGQSMYAQAIADQYSALADLVQFCGLSGINQLLEVGAPPASLAPPQPQP